MNRKIIPLILIGILVIVIGCIGPFSDDKPEMVNGELADEEPEMVNGDQLIDIEVLRSRAYEVPEEVLPENNPEVGDEVTLELFDGETETCTISRAESPHAIDSFGVTCDIGEFGFATFSTSDEGITIGSIEDPSGVGIYKIAYNRTDEQNYLQKIERVPKE